MAQRFLGIDVGARALRVIELVGSPRSLSVGGYYTAPIYTREDQPREEAEAEAFARLGAEVKWTAEVIGCGLPSNGVFATRIDLPFSDPKLIEQVLPMKLVGKMPMGDDDLLDFALLGPSEDGEEYNALVVGCAGSEVETLLASLDAIDCDPRVIAPPAHTLYHLARFLLPHEEEAAYAIVDLGASRAQCTLVEGHRYQSGRTFLSSGDALSAALAEALDLEFEQADGLKVARGFVAPPGREREWAESLALEPAHVDGEPVAPEAIAAPLRDALGPLIFGLRQTLSAYSAANQRPVERIELIGGGALLAGLPEYLSNALGVETRRLKVEHPEVSAMLSLEGAGTEALSALSIALAASESGDRGGSGAMVINLRRGRLSHKGGLDFLREHMVSFVAMAAALVFAVVFLLGAKYYALQTERDHLESTLQTVTESLFKKPLVKKDRIKAEFSSVKGFDFIPERTAYYHLTAITRVLHKDFFDGNTKRKKTTPEAEPLNFEILSLNINTTSKSIAIQAVVNDIEALELMKQSLGRYKCFPSRIEQIDQRNARNDPGYIEFKLKIPIKTHCEEDT